jgi:hypothetical protein
MPDRVHIVRATYLRCGKPAVPRHPQLDSTVQSASAVENDSNEHSWGRNHTRGHHRGGSLFCEAGLVCCNQSTVNMRVCARLTSTKLTPLSRLGTTRRTSDSKYLFQAEFLFHHKTPCIKGGQLSFRDNGHGPTLQKAAYKCAIYLQAAVVMDKALLLERTHKFTYPCAGGTNHLREGCLAHLQGVLRL